MIKKTIERHLAEKRCDASIEKQSGIYEKILVISSFFGIFSLDALSSGYCLGLDGAVMTTAPVKLALEQLRAPTRSCT